MIVDHVIDRVHQILILDGDLASAALPPPIQINVDSIRELYQAANYKRWSSPEIESLIIDNFDPEVIWAYRTLKPYSYKSDLARFCLLYVLGGMYVDLGVRLIGQWRIPYRYGISAFRDVRFVGGSWSAMQTGLLWSMPGREELSQAIRWIVENCRNRYYGANPLYPTGPVLLGRAFIAAMATKGQTDDADDQLVGDCRRVTPDAKMENISYVSREGTVVALRTKLVAGDLTHLGIKGGNNYNQIWNARQVYGEREQVWPWSDVQITADNGSEKTKTGLAVRRGMTETISHGPYVDLAEGDYELEVVISPETNFSRASLEVTARCGAELVFKSSDFSQHVRHPEIIAMPFSLDESKTSVEFRLTPFGDFDGEVVAFKLSRAPARTWRFDNKAIRAPDLKRSAEGLTIPLGTLGRVIYGPYVTVEPGTYDLEIEFSSRTQFSNLHVDVCTDQGILILKDHKFNGPTIAHHASMAFRFNAAASLEDVEFRIAVFGDFEGEFKSFCLRPLELSQSASVEQARAGLVVTLSQADE